MKPSSESDAHRWIFIMQQIDINYWINTPWLWKRCIMKYSTSHSDRHVFMICIINPGSPGATLRCMFTHYSISICIVLYNILYSMGKITKNNSRYTICMGNCFAFIWFSAISLFSDLLLFEWRSRYYRSPLCQGNTPNWEYSTGLNQSLLSVWCLVPWVNCFCTVGQFWWKTVP